MVYGAWFMVYGAWFMVYGIIRAVSVTCYPYLNINMVYGTMFMVCGSCMS